MERGLRTVKRRTAGWFVLKKRRFKSVAFRQMSIYSLYFGSILKKKVNPKMDIEAKRQSLISFGNINNKGRSIS